MLARAAQRWNVSAALLAAQIYAAFTRASETTLKGILRTTTEPIVSCDVIGDPAFNNSQGRTYIYFGGNPPNTTVDLVFNGEAGGDFYGGSVF